MKKAFWLLLLATLLACGPTTTDPESANIDEEADTAVSNTEDAEEVAEAEANDESAAEESVEESTETEASPLAAATNFDDFSPASTVEEAATIREQDWRKGATDPSVVIIEYGDFQ